MKRMAIGAAVVALAFSTAAAPLSAQAIVSSPVRFGIMGGVTFPIGDVGGVKFSDVAKTGWNAGALVSIGVPLVPVSFRVEGQWHQLNGQPGNTEGGFTTDFRVIDGTANAVYTFGAALPTKFYVIGGLGAYNVRANVRDPDITTSGTTSASAWKFGLNAGVGVKFQLTGFATFIEARYHNIIHGTEIGDTGFTGSSLQMIPISIGITF
jgi:opacity protein-like surface antigen